MRFRTLLSLVIILGALFFVFSDPANTPTGMTSLDETEILSVAAWNLQVFGPSKASNAIFLENVVDVIDDYDIVFISEIRDASQSAFITLCDELPSYSCMVSSRAGYSTVKEQIGVIYRTGLDVSPIIDYNPDYSMLFNRPPIAVDVTFKDKMFRVYSIHVDPDDVVEELNELEQLVVDNSIIIGDLNADCKYYDVDFNNHFKDMTWFIKDDDDTTSYKTDCAYDRIIGDKDLDIVAWGVNQKTSKDLSDHYLVWFKIN